MPNLVALYIVSPPAGILPAIEDMNTRCPDLYVIVFHSLTREHITLIVGILARDVQKRLGEEELTLRLTQGATDFLVDHGYDEHFGARPLKRAIQKYVEDPLSEKILVGDRSEEHTSELQSHSDLVCRLLLEK